MAIDIMTQVGLGKVHRAAWGLGLGFYIAQHGAWAGAFTSRSMGLGMWDAGGFGVWVQRVLALLHLPGSVRGHRSLSALTVGGSPCQPSIRPV